MKMRCLALIALIFVLGQRAQADPETPAPPSSKRQAMLERHARFQARAREIADKVSHPCKVTGLPMADFEFLKGLWLSEDGTASLGAKFNLDAPAELSILEGDDEQALTGTCQVCLDAQGHFGLIHPGEAPGIGAIPGSQRWFTLTLSADKARLTVEDSWRHADEEHRDKGVYVRPADCSGSKFGPVTESAERKALLAGSPYGSRWATNGAHGSSGSKTWTLRPDGTIEIREEYQPDYDENGDSPPSTQHYDSGRFELQGDKLVFCMEKGGPGEVSVSEDGLNTGAEVLKPHTSNE